MKLKTLATLLSTLQLFNLSTFQPAHAKTFDWPIDSPNARAASFTAYHGETVRFNLRFGGAMTNLAPVAIYYQTNGMGRAEWFTVPGTVFAPSNDCGAAAYRFFVRCLDPDGVDYSANGTLRMLDSPGFEPSVVSPPVKTLDFSTVTVLNAPWIEEESDPTVPAWAKNPTPPLTEESGFNSFTNQGGTLYGPLTLHQPEAYPGSDASVVISTNGVTGWGFHELGTPGLGYWSQFAFNWVDLITSESDPTVPSWAKASQKPSYTAAEVGAVPTSRKINGQALTSDITINAGVTSVNTKTGAVTLDASDVGAYPNASGELLASQVSSIGAHLNAEDARFVSTNYDSVVRMPEAYVEVRLADNCTNVWTKIWSEMTRWGKFVGNAFDWNAWGGFHAWATNVMAELSHKADRAWGAYDSETGGYSPEGYTQISSSNILIAAGMAYQRTITTGGAAWVLQCNQGTARIGGDTNGFFRVVDGDGVTQFEIVKGDRREMGADASGITVSSGNVMTIPYSVESADHPTIRCCSDLNAANWKDETDADCLCTVSWSGSSGAWVATVTPKTSQPAMFVKATFMAGGETYIRNNAPVGMASIVLNGTKYYLGTATISGHTVLTLSTTPIQ